MEAKDIKQMIQALQKSMLDSFKEKLSTANTSKKPLDDKALQPLIDRHILEAFEIGKAHAK